MPREQHRHGKHHKHHDTHEHHHYRHGNEPAERERERGHHHEKSSRSSRSRSRKRETDHGGAEYEVKEKCASSPVKSSTMPTMSPITHHYHRQTMAMSESQHCLADTQLIRLNLPPGQNGHGSASTHKYADMDSQRAICKEPSPVKSYAKPDLSLDYRSKRQKTAPSHATVIADEVVNGKNMHKALQQELEDKIQNRKRSQSVSSRAERSYYNLPERSFEEKNESHYCMTEHGIEPERLAPQVSRPPKHNDQTSSNDTVFYDKELLSDLYREKENKCSDLSRTKRTRTKSESRGLSDENSPTMPSDNDQVLNLLRGNRRPLEVDAREFRVLKEKLLREQQFSTNAKREQKSSKTEFQDKNRTESDIKICDKINGKLPGSERSKEGYKEEDIFWRDQVKYKESQTERFEVVHEDARGKSSRKSRRENYEIESKELKHKKSDTDSGIRQKRAETKPTQEKHGSTKESELKKRDSFPLQYTREEKEWLKEKLLEEFERQEKMQRQGDVLVHTGLKGSLPMKDRLNAESGKENPITFTTTDASRKKGSSQKSTEDSFEKVESETRSKGDLSPLEISPPCTCGQSPGSPERKSINHDTVVEVPISAMVRQPPRYKSIHHDGITEPSDGGPGLLDPGYGVRTKTPDTSLGRKGTKIKSSSSKDWAELIEMSRVSQDQFLSAQIPDTWDGHSDDRGRSQSKSPAQFQSKSSKESQNLSPINKESSRQSNAKVSPSIHSRHSAATRERSPREPFKPSTMPRESSPSQNQHTRNSTVPRDHSPGLQSTESCDQFQTNEQPSTKQNSRHSFSCESSLPHSPPPYVHPKSCDSPGHHKSTSQDSDNHRCSCQSCECRSSGHGHYTSDENIHGLTNGGFHRNGSLRSTECRSEGPFHPHGERGPGEGPFHIEDRGDSHHMTLEQPYRGDPLPLYPEMENARGKVNIVIFSGVKLRRQHWCFLALVLVVAVICLGVLLPMSGNTGNLSKEQQKNLIAQLLTEVPLIDGHNDLPWNIRQFIHNKLEKVNLSTNIQYAPPWSTSKWSHTDFLRMRKGQVGAQLWTAYAPCGSQHKDAVQITLEQIDLIKRLVEQYSDYLQLAQTAQEIVDAHKNGRIASVITVESGHSIGTSLGVLRTFQRLGVRALTLTHNCDTPWADCSNADKPGAIPQHNGLTPFGKTVVQEMNRLGIIVDLSHTSVQTARDALATSEAPVIFSHSSAHAICNASRNVPDDILRIVAERKGLVMVNFFSYFLTCSNHSTLNDVIGHINHIRNIAGVDSVGIGASYDGINEVPVGLPDVGHYPELFVALLDSGLWAIEDLKKLAGLNFLRVLKAVEKVAVSMSGL